MYLIVVWHNLNKDIYYHKIVKGTYKIYFVGYKNQYNHEIVDLIPNIYLNNSKASFKKKVLTRLISFLQKINK